MRDFIEDTWLEIRITVGDIVVDIEDYMINDFSLGNAANTVKTAVFRFTKRLSS